MSHKLYKELGLSIALGTTISAAYPYYYWRKYNNVVDESYEMVKKKFEKNPALFQNQDSNKGIVKNFGLSKYNDADIEDEEEFEMEN